MWSKVIHYEAKRYMTQSDAKQWIQFLRGRGESPKAIAEAAAATIGVVDGAHYDRLGRGGWIRPYLTIIEADCLWRLHGRQQCAKLYVILGRRPVISAPPSSLRGKTSMVTDGQAETYLALRCEIAWLLGLPPKDMDRRRNRGILPPQSPQMSLYQCSNPVPTIGGDR